MVTRLLAFAVLASSVTSAAYSQNVPAPPDWQDGPGASVYLEANTAAKPVTGASTISPSTNNRYAVVNPTNVAAATPQTIAPPVAVPSAPHVDSAIRPASFDAPAT